ncbi:DMT family transporter [Streptacidiphilus jiangxiensis]|uniref:Permease of the drug/metabolite transporter (DMT) superfamily n=1 Tax=Streptacidiphilus jiangxiensis TaxID=235985 RepID=A0A1H7N004_STRJI|nr:DMT family transporter [Streptacidiphilus jiangxiensis]SEL16840.1 Permease of the drug/metabolite transporter (DMT) superfamily [Streptacidiphilus jiangxiensis]
MPSSRTTVPTGLVDGLLLVVAAVWGSTYLAAKDLVTDRTVVAILGLRFLLTAVALAPVCAHRLRRASRAEIGTGLLLGAILATVMTLETYGVAGTSATNAGLIISLTIVMTPLLENLVARSWLPPAFFVAAVLAVVGVALLASGSSLRAPSVGDLLVLAAAAVRAVHVTVMHRRSAGRQFDSLNLTWLQLSVGAVVFCAVSPLAGDSAVAVAGRLHAGQWADLLYLALVCTVFAFFVQMWAVRSTSPSRVSLLLGTEPIWALAVGVLLGGDRIGWTGVLGAVLVLAGTNWGRRVERAHRERAGGASSLAATGDALPRGADAEAQQPA